MTVVVGDPRTDLPLGGRELLTSGVAVVVTTDAVQIIVGCSPIRRFPGRASMPDAKITQHEGTNQIQT